MFLWNIHPEPFTQQAQIHGMNSQQNLQRSSLSYSPKGGMGAANNLQVLGRGGGMGGGKDSIAPPVYPYYGPDPLKELFFVKRSGEDLRGGFRPDMVAWENEAIQYWKVFFDFSFYTLLTPFRFVWDKSAGLYKCHTSRLQKVLQWILCILTTIYFLLNLHRMSKLDPEENPSLYFQVAYYFFDTTFLVALFLGFGRQMKIIMQVCTDIQSQNTRFYQRARNPERRARMTAIICIGCLGTLLLQLLETLKDCDWDFQGFLKYWQDDAADVFHTPALTDLCPFCFGMLSMTSSLFEKLLNAFSDILFTMTVLMFNNLVDSFHADMESSGEDACDGEHVLEHYWWLKYITSQMNASMSLINAAFIAGNLPFYATNVFEVFGDANIFMRLRYMFYCSYWFPSLCVAANANYKMDRIKSWICKEENYSQIPDKKLKVFLHEIHYHTFGIGAYGMFCVTWHTVSSIISVILSYALLKSQLKNEAAKEDVGLGGFNATESYNSSFVM